MAGEEKRLFSTWFVIRTFFLQRLKKKYKLLQSLPMGKGREKTYCDFTFQITAHSLSLPIAQKRARVIRVLEGRGREKSYLFSRSHEAPIVEQFTGPFTLSHSHSTPFKTVKLTLSLPPSPLSSVHLWPLGHVICGLQTVGRRECFRRRCSKCLLQETGSQLEPVGSRRRETRPQQSLSRLASTESILDRKHSHVSQSVW